MGAGMLCVDTIHAPGNNAPREVFVEVGVYEVPEYLSIPENIFPACTIPIYFPLILYRRVKYEW